eukprot:3200949-Rhodomonas_salina.1
MAQMKAGDTGFPMSHQSRRLVQWAWRCIKSLQPRGHFDLPLTFTFAAAAQQPIGLCQALCPGSRRLPVPRDSPPVTGTGTGTKTLMIKSP